MQGQLHRQAALGAAEQPLRGRRALVVGGGSGIGRASAKALHAAGAAVTVADREPAEISGASGQRVDVRRGDEIDQLFARLQAADGLPDLLLVSAGVGLYERLCEGDPEKWQVLFDTNVMGPLRLIRAFVPPMLERGGDIVIVGSVAAAKPHPWGGVYAASKAALESLAETLRLEVQPRVRVITVSPGVVDTEFFSHLLSGEQSVDAIGCGSISAEQVADVILYALTRPAGMALNHLTVRPREQEF